MSFSDARISPGSRVCVHCVAQGSSERGLPEHLTFRHRCIRSRSRINIQHSCMQATSAPGLATHAEHTARRPQQDRVWGGVRETSDGEKEAMVLAVCWHRNHSLLVVLGHIFFACRHFARRQHRPPPSDATGLGFPAFHDTSEDVFPRKRREEKNEKCNDLQRSFRFTPLGLAFCFFPF